MNAIARVARCDVSVQKTIPHHSAQPKCRLGIAANGLATALATGELYDHSPPMVSSVSTKPCHGNRRGGASGNAQ